MTHFGRAAIFVALFLWTSTFAAKAQDVTLISQDGTVEISGQLLGFDGEFYRVDSIYGELTVDGSGVRCEGPGCPNLQDFVAEVTFSGSATMGAVLLPSLIEAFALREGYNIAKSPDGFFTLSDTTSGRQVARVELRNSTTDEGFADLLANEADIVMALREIRREERTRASEAGMGDLTGANRSRVLGLDAIVPIVSPGNPIQDMSPQTLARILAGRLTQWSEIGGPDAPITVHVPDLTTGLGQSVEDQVLKPAQLELMSTVVRHAHPDALRSAVLQDPFAIGVVSHSEIGRAQEVVLRGSCGFALKAARRTIKTEDYPLTAPMFLYMPARRLPKVARDFLAYTRGPAAQVVIRRAGFVDQTPEEIPIELQGNRFRNAIANAGPEIGLDELQRMSETLKNMDRLTTSFRFETGSSRLDAQSRSNVEQFARALEAGTYDERRILFVGFSDGIGNAAINRNIAMERAQAVRQAILSAAETANFNRISIGVEAFGEALPMACDDSAWGRQVNRRVEVWVR